MYITLIVVGTVTDSDFDENIISDSYGPKSNVNSRILIFGYPGAGKMTIFS